MEPKYQFKTDYFSRPSTWYGKAALTAGFCYMVFYLDGHIVHSILDYRYVSTLIVGILIFIYPKGDVFIDATHFIYVRRSLIGRFTSSLRFETANIVDFRIARPSPRDQLTRVTPPRNVEIVFVDGDIKSFTFALTERELRTIAEILKRKKIK